MPEQCAFIRRKQMADLQGHSLPGSRTPALDIGSFLRTAAFIMLAMLSSGAAFAAQATLKWSDVAGDASGFEIDRSTDGTNFTQIATVGAGVLTYVDTSAEASTQYWYAVTAYNGTGSSSFTNIVSVTTMGTGAAPTVTNALPASGTVGTAFSYSIVASNSPTSYGATPLPPGLVVNTSTGAITGTPTAAGTSDVTISASNGTGTGSATLVITVAAEGMAPTVTSALSAECTVGTSTSYTIVASNGPTSYNATPLPPGFSIDTSTGVITGTPTAAGTTDITISASNPTGTGSATLVMSVATEGIAPSITSALSTSGTVGSSIGYTIGASNSPTRYNATSLPAGLSVNTSTGAISGIPTASGTTDVTISATNATGTGSATLIITVAPQGITPSITSPLAASGTVGTSLSYNIDASNTPTRYNATPLPAGLSVNTSTGSITGVPTSSGTTNVTISATNVTGTGSATLVITVAPQVVAPSVTSALTASGTVGTPFSYTIVAGGNPTSYSANSLPAGLSFSASSGAITGTPTSAGTSNVTIGATNAAGTGTATLVVTISAAGAAPSITSSLAASATVGSAFTYTIAASNRPTRYSATPLPSGFSINTSNGSITGTPSASGTANVTISASNATGTGSATLVITVAAAGVAPSITSPLVASGVAGTPFSYSVTASGIPTTYFADLLPAGLSINASSGAITGTPASTGTNNVTIGATNAVGTASATLVITVSAAGPVPSVTSALTASGTVGTPFSYVVTASGNPTSYFANSLPAGLSISASSGAITGTPTTAGTSYVTIGVTNGDGTGSSTLVITVAPSGVGPVSTGTAPVTTVPKLASTPGTTVSNNTTAAWLSNLSARAYTEVGQNGLVAGFATSGTAAKSLLIRGIGPGLSEFGITNFLADPKLTLFNSMGSSLMSVTSWASSLEAIFQEVGAFSLTPGSNDASFVQSVNPGAYTAEVASATSNEAVALAEIFDVSPGDPVNRLVNLSARALVGTGANDLIGGFVIGGTGPETLLIRADGPALATFGVTDVLTNPVLSIYDSTGLLVHTITGWGANSTSSAGPGFNPTAGMSVSAATPDVFASVGAFPLTSGSADSALVISLPAGAYTADVSGSSGGTGVALVEIYEVQ